MSTVLSYARHEGIRFLSRHENPAGVRAHETPTSRNYPGTGYELPGGGFVGRRQSERFGPTLDVNIPGVHDVRKVHVGHV